MCHSRKTKNSNSKLNLSTTLIRPHSFLFYGRTLSVGGRLPWDFRNSQVSTTQTGSTVEEGSVLRVSGNKKGERISETGKSETYESFSKSLNFF